MLNKSKLAAALSTLKHGLGRMRTLRASLWLLPIQILTIAILVGVSQESPNDDLTNLHDTYFAATVALVSYITAISLGHFGFGAWSAARDSYGVLRCISLQFFAVLFVLLALIPVYVAVIDPSIMDYFACSTLKCRVLVPMGATLFCILVTLAAVIPTSVLWFLLAKPKGDNPAFISGVQNGTQTNMANHTWNGHSIEIESYAIPKLFWFGLNFSVRVDGKSLFQSPDKFEGFHTVVPFEIATADSVKHGRVVSGHPCSTLYAVYRVFIDDQEVAKGVVRARNWYITYGIIAIAVAIFVLMGTLF